MTRKDYEAIAAAIRHAESAMQDYSAACLEPSIMVHAVALSVADALGRDNPRFDRERFLKACGAQ